MYSDVSLHCSLCLFDPPTNRFGCNARCLLFLLLLFRGDVGLLLILMFAFFCLKCRVLEFRRCLIVSVGDIWSSLSLSLFLSLSLRIIYLILVSVSRFCVLIHQSSVPAIDGSLFRFLRNDVGLLLDLLVLEHEVSFLVVLDGCCFE